MKKRKFLEVLSSIPGLAFLLSYLIVIIPALIINLSFSKDLIHLRINSFHNPSLDSLMKLWTYLGDGLIIFILLLGLAFISFRHFISGFAAYILGGLGAQAMKKLIFTNSPRPLKFFELNFPDTQLYLVPGVDMHTWFSFPSGHAATAFAVFFVLSLYTKSKALQIALFILATGVAYSRVYLSEHFFGDVIAGSILGMIMGCVAFLIFRNIKIQWIDKSALSLGSRFKSL